MIRWSIGVAECVLLCASPIHAQNVTEPRLKAVFLLNFVKFTDWPADTVGPDGPLSLCVLGDEAVRSELEQIVKGSKIGGHTLSVIPVNPESDLRMCGLLYVTGLDRRRLAQLIARVRYAPVFTVSDYDPFAALGGVLQLFVEGGNMRFAINPEAALRAHLRISSKVLALAKLVKDESDGER